MTKGRAMTHSPLLIYGAGGFAREVAWLAEVCQTHGSGCAPVGYIDDAVHAGDSPRLLNGLPVFDLETAARKFPNAGFTVGIGNPLAREVVTGKALAAGLQLSGLIHPRVEMSRFVEIGAGAVICAGCIITTNIVLGAGVQINLDCTVGHDAILGDFSTLAPGVHISGNVHLGRRVYVGTGAVIINGSSDAPLVIGDDAIIGAGACVTRSIASGLTAVGVPAKPLERKIVASHAAA